MGIPGPPPKDDDKRARRNATHAMTGLPAGGRVGAPPRWPLPTDAALSARLKVARALARDKKALAEAPDITARERAARDRSHASAAEKVALLEVQVRDQRRRETGLWKELWATPMAVMWDRLRWTREVALYVRFQAKAELGDTDAAKEARLRSATLGLTPESMQKLRWRVDAKPADGADVAAPAGPKSGARSTYGHLRVAE